MTPEEARKAFKRIYPESYVKITRLEQIDEYYLISAMFPDGTYFFIVDACSVSAAFDSYTDAKRSI